MTRSTGAPHVRQLLTVLLRGAGGGSAGSRGTVAAATGVPGQGPEGASSAAGTAWAVAKRAVWGSGGGVSTNTSSLGARGAVQTAQGPTPLAVLASRLLRSGGGNSGGGCGGGGGPSGVIARSWRAVAGPAFLGRIAGAGVAVRAAAAAAVGPGAARGGSAASLVRTIWQDTRGYQHFEGRGRAWMPSGPRTRAAVAVLVVGGASYYVYCLETVPYTGRRHSIMLVSQANEKMMGRMVFEEQKALAAAEGRLLPPSHPDAKRVRRLGEAIAAVAADGAGGGQYSHMKGLQWDFAVIDNPTPNAFVVPGGKVVVFTGLMRLLGHSDDELAAVMAHEVGHVLARHTAERLSTLNVWALFNMVLRMTLGFRLPDVAMYLGLFLPYSRLAEEEADMIGLRLMARACFDPQAAPSMLQKLNDKEKQLQKRGMVPAIPAFLRTHPLTEHRVHLVERELQDAYRLYKEAGCAAPRGDFSRGAAALFGASWGAGGLVAGSEGEIVHMTCSCGLTA